MGQTKPQPTQDPSRPPSEKSKSEINLAPNSYVSKKPRDPVFTAMVMITCWHGTILNMIFYEQKPRFRKLLPVRFLQGCVLGKISHMTNITKKREPYSTRNTRTTKCTQRNRSTRLTRTAKSTGTTKSTSTMKSTRTTRITKSTRSTRSSKRTKTTKNTTREAQKAQEPQDHERHENQGERENREEHEDRETTTSMRTTRRMRTMRSTGEPCTRTAKSARTTSPESREEDA